MKCRRCGRENPVGTRRCKHCGVPMVSPSAPHRNRRKESEQIDSLIIVLIIALVVLIAIVAGVALNQSRPTGGGGFSGGGGGGGSLPPPSFGIHTQNPSMPSENTEEPTPSQTSTPSPEVEIEPEDDENQALSKKEEFIEKAKDIEEYELEYLEPATSQLEMNRQSATVLQMWDDLLNEVYQYLKEILSYSEFEQLKEGELEWIAEKEAAIEEAAEDWTGGSAEPMIRNLTAIEWTKNRFNYLLSLI